MRRKGLDLPIDSQPLDFPKEPENEPQGRLAAGLVLLTHGFDVGLAKEPQWLTSLQDAILCRLASRGRKGRLLFSGDRKNLSLNLQWLDPSNKDPSDAETFIRVDWTRLANHLVSPVNTQTLAQALARFLLSSDELRPYLTKASLHFIGHSRGASLFCELSRLLGQEGLTVDHLTLLDPHPLTLQDPQPPGQDPILDAPVQLPANVRFCDNYWQAISYPRGEKVSGAYNRKFEKLPGGYHGTLQTGFAQHHNLVLLYQATVQTEGEIFNDEVTLKEKMRHVWFAEQEKAGHATGYVFSRPICPETRPDPTA